MSSRAIRWVCRSVGPCLAILLAMAAGAAAGCGPDQSPAGASPKQLTAVVGAGPSNLDPDKDISGQALTFWISMFDALTTFDEKMKVVPALATSWQTVNDTTWEFKLRPNVKFHNGEPFNAQAVKFSLERILDPAQKTANLSRMPLLKGVEVVDDLTVRILTNGPAPYLPHGLIWGWMKPPGYVKEKGDAYFAQNPVGTGPFKFVDWVQGQYTNMVANPDYWGGRPKLDKLTIKTTPDASVQVASLKAGEAQMITGMPAPLVKEVQATKGVKVIVWPFASVITVNLYTGKGGPVGDKRVRQALNYAVDKQTILEKILEGYGAIAQGQVVTAEAFGFDPETKAYPYDPQKAKQLLAEAGYPNGFKMPLTTSWGRFAMDKEITITLVDQLARVGVQAEVNNIEYGVWQQLRVKGEIPNNLSTFMNYGDARFGMQMAVSKSTAPYFASPEFDRLFKLSERAMDPKEREQLLRQAIKLMHEEAACIFLFDNVAIYGVSDQVVGWQPHASGWMYFHKADLKP